MCVCYYKRERLQGNIAYKPENSAHKPPSARNTAFIPPPPLIKASHLAFCPDRNNTKKLRQILKISCVPTPLPIKLCHPLSSEPLLELSLASYHPLPHQTVISTL